MDYYIWFVYMFGFLFVSTMASDCLERVILKWLIMCQARCRTLLTHSPTH